MGRKSSNTLWFPLNPELADYRSVNGARVAGQTLLETDSGTVIVVGHLSCGTRESAERHARLLNGARGDRHVSYETLVSWRAKN